MPAIHTRAIREALTSPVNTEDMGILAEVFQNYPGVRVNDHAADRFAAFGPAAEDLLYPCPLHDYHGLGSVLERLVQTDGLVLRLGANSDTVTLTHYAEYLADIPDKRRVRRRYVRADVGEQWIESLDHDDGVAVSASGDMGERRSFSAGAARQYRRRPRGVGRSWQLPR